LHITIIGDVILLNLASGFHLSIECKSNIFNF